MKISELLKKLRRRPRLVPDLFFCAVLMPALVVLGPAHYWPAQWPLFFVVACVFMYGSYFAVVGARVPQLVMRRDYRRLAVLSVVLVGLNWLLTRYPLPEMEFVTPAMSRYQTSVRNFGVSLSLWLMFVLVAGYGLAVSFVGELYEQQLLKRRIEAQRDKAELAMFKAQISPHFLFNTLNTLYSLVIGTSEKAESAFVKFSELLRYSYVTVNQETVALGQEIDYIRNYVDLQMIRLNGNTRLDWEDTVGNPDARIAPMLMLTFVENAFKYGASATDPCLISIAVRESGGHLNFSTRNAVMRHRDTFAADVPVGLENTRSRLNALYPGRHSLRAGRHGDLYIVELEIDLDHHDRRPS